MCNVRGEDAPPYNSREFGILGWGSRRNVRDSGRVKARLGRNARERRCFTGHLKLIGGDDMPRLARRQHKDGNGQAAFNLRPTGFIDHGPSFKFRRTFFEPVLNARLCVRSRPPEPNLLSMPYSHGRIGSGAERF
jgi:hypothetical protein